jgi:hypothetical protein
MQNNRVVFAYKAGFRRLWLVLSLFWAIAILIIVVRDHDIQPMTGLWIAVIPSVVLYAIGVALVWIVEGFARSDR